MEFEKLAISERKIIVGIDFGTTYSGVAWAETQRPDRRVAVTSWPISKTNHEGESSDKVPTKIRYSGDKVEWGFSIPMDAPSDQIMEWFKLDLDPSLQSMGSAVSQSATRGGRNVDKLVTDYISALGDHLRYTLREKLGDGVLKSTPMEFIVTVPAIWSDLAKDKTKQACQRASGLSATNATIHLISEPEAAAIYTLHGLDPHGLEEGDSFVICDAGGGTVDLVTYTITSLKPILEVEEATPGTGALCGSTFLNMRFAKFLKAKLGNEDGFDDEVLAEAMDRFEKTTKRQFTMNAVIDQTYTIPVGGLANNKALGISRGRFSLKGTELMSIFEPVVLEVIELVKNQIEASKVPIRAVLLVGGFGASNYLKTRLRGSIERRIQIMQPPNAWLAVVHGAVMKGLAQSAPKSLTMVQVRNRKARKHYGIELRVKFDKKVHSSLRDKKTWSGLAGRWEVNAMCWFIEKGDAVSENEPFFISLAKSRLVSEGRIREIAVTVYANRTSLDAPLSRNGNVSELCRVEADISHIPEDLLNRRKGYDGQWYYYLSCKLEAVYLSASTRYTLLYNNQRYTSVTAEYV